jgi:hypothetical protein
VRQRVTVVRRASEIDPATVRFLSGDKAATLWLLAFQAGMSLLTSLRAPKEQIDEFIGILRAKGFEAEDRQLRSLARHLLKECLRSQRTALVTTSFWRSEPPRAGERFPMEWAPLSSFSVNAPFVIPELGSRIWACVVRHARWGARRGFAFRVPENLRHYSGGRREGARRMDQQFLRDLAEHRRRPLEFSLDKVVDRQVKREEDGRRLAEMLEEALKPPRYPLGSPGHRKVIERRAKRNLGKPGNPPQ